MSDPYLIQRFSENIPRGGLTQIGAGISALVQQKRAQAAAQAEQEAYNEQLGQFMNSQSPEDLFKLYEMAPAGKLDALKEGWAQMSAQQRQNEINSNMQIIGALQTGNVELAVNRLQDQADAALNSGNEKEAQVIQGFIDQVGSGEPGAKAVQNMLSIMTGATQEGADAIANLNKLNVEERAGQVHEANLLKTATELGLTPAQKAEMIPLARDFGLDTASMILELAPAAKAGDLDTEELADLTGQLRKEYTKDISAFRSADQTKAKIDSALTSDSSAGDIASITLFMKMLDEGSVVREGEFKIAAESGGFLDTLRNIASKWVDGQRLQPAQRQAFKSLTDDFYKIAEERAGEIDTRMRNVTDFYGIPENQVFFIEEEQPPAPQPVVATPAIPTVGGDRLALKRAQVKAANPQSNANFDIMTDEQLNQYRAGRLFDEQNPVTAAADEEITEVDF